MKRFMHGGYVHQRHASPVRWLAIFHPLLFVLRERRNLPLFVLLWLLWNQEYPPDWLLWLLPQVRDDGINPDSHLRLLLRLKFLLGISLSSLLSPHPLLLLLIFYPFLHLHYPGSHINGTG